MPANVADIFRLAARLGEGPQVPEKETCHREVGTSEVNQKIRVGAIPIDQIKAALFDTEAEAKIVPAADPA